jgi:hypothetical protein
VIRRAWSIFTAQSATKFWTILAPLVDDRLGNDRSVYKSVSALPWQNYLRQPSSTPGSFAHRDPALLSRVRIYIFDAPQWSYPPAVATVKFPEPLTVAGGFD